MPRALPYEVREEFFALVCGGAFGIDPVAIRGTLAVGGRPMVVLPCGDDDIAYPSAHAARFNQVCEAGGEIVSEYPEGTRPNWTRALERNRTIAEIAVDP